MNTILVEYVKSALSRERRHLSDLHVTFVKEYLDECPAFSKAGNEVLKAHPDIFAEWAEEVESGKRTWLARHPVHQNAWRLEVQRLADNLSALVHSEADDCNVRIEMFDIIFELAKVRPQTSAC